uniref:THD domain-containing protein n=1 Tax=Poecilia mexicana TaxID=48701 RepID=A0A3B3WXK4_9TELE
MFNPFFSFVVTVILAVDLTAHTEMVPHLFGLCILCFTCKKKDLQSYFVFLSTLSVPKRNITNGKYLLWEHEEGRAYIDGGFRYYNGSLVVPRKGFYRVFLQTLYEIDTSHCVGKHFLVLSSFVTVYQQSYNEDRPLLTAEDTVICKDYKKDKVDYIKKSLFTSGTFKLDANDKLHVTSSHPDFMPQNEYQSFFGAHKCVQIN